MFNCLYKNNHSIAYPTRKVLASLSLSDIRYEDDVLSKYSPNCFILTNYATAQFPGELKYINICLNRLLTFPLNH